VCVRESVCVTERVCVRQRVPRVFLEVEHEPDLRRAQLRYGEHGVYGVGGEKRGREREREARGRNQVTSPSRSTRPDRCRGYLEESRLAVRAEFSLPRKLLGLLLLKLLGFLSQIIRFPIFPIRVYLEESRLAVRAEFPAPSQMPLLPPTPFSRTRFSTCASLLRLLHPRYWSRACGKEEGRGKCEEFPAPSQMPLLPPTPFSS